MRSLSKKKLLKVLALVMLVVFSCQQIAWAEVINLRTEGDVGGSDILLAVLSGYLQARAVNPSWEAMHIFAYTYGIPKVTQMITEGLGIDNPILKAAIETGLSMGTTSYFDLKLGEKVASTAAKIEENAAKAGEKAGEEAAEKARTIFTNPDIAPAELERAMTDAYTKAYQEAYSASIKQQLAAISKSAGRGMARRVEADIKAREGIAKASAANESAPQTAAALRAAAIKAVQGFSYGLVREFLYQKLKGSNKYLAKFLAGTGGLLVGQYVGLWLSKEQGIVFGIIRNWQGRGLGPIALKLEGKELEAALARGSSIPGMGFIVEVPGMSDFWRTFKISTVSNAVQTLAAMVGGEKWSEAGVLLSAGISQWMANRQNKQFKPEDKEKSAERLLLERKLLTADSAAVQEAIQEEKERLGVLMRIHREDGDREEVMALENRMKELNDVLQMMPDISQMSNSDKQDRRDALDVLIARREIVDKLAGANDPVRMHLYQGQLAMCDRQIRQMTMSDSQALRQGLKYGAISALLQRVSTATKSPVHGAYLNLFLTSLLKAQAVDNKYVFGIKGGVPAGDLNSPAVDSLVQGKKDISFYENFFTASMTNAQVDAWSMGRATPWINEDGTFSFNWHNPNDIFFIARYHQYIKAAANKEYGITGAMFDQFISSMHNQSVNNLMERGEQVPYVKTLERPGRAAIDDAWITVVSAAQALDRTPVKINVVNQLQIGDTVTAGNGRTKGEITDIKIDATTNNAHIYVRWDDDTESGISTSPTAPVSGHFAAAERARTTSIASYLGQDNSVTKQMLFADPVKRQRAVLQELKSKEPGERTPQEQGLIDAIEENIRLYNQDVKAWNASGHGTAQWMILERSYTPDELSSPSPQVEEMLDNLGDERQAARVQEKLATQSREIGIEATHRAILENKDAIEKVLGREVSDNEDFGAIEKEFFEKQPGRMRYGGTAAMGVPIFKIAYPPERQAYSKAKTEAVEEIIGERSAEIERGLPQEQPVRLDIFRHLPGNSPEYMVRWQEKISPRPPLPEEPKKKNVPRPETPPSLPSVPESKPPKVPPATPGLEPPPLSPTPQQKPPVSPPKATPLMGPLEMPQGKPITIDCPFAQEVSLGKGDYGSGSATYNLQFAPDELRKFLNGGIGEASVQVVDSKGNFNDTGRTQKFTFDRATGKMWVVDDSGKKVRTVTRRVYFPDYLEAFRKISAGEGDNISERTLRQMRKEAPVVLDLAAAFVSKGNGDYDRVRGFLETQGVARGDFEIRIQLAVQDMFRGRFENIESARQNTAGWNEWAILKENPELAKAYILRHAREHGKDYQAVNSYMKKILGYGISEQEWRGSSPTPAPTAPRPAPRPAAPAPERPSARPAPAPQPPQPKTEPEIWRDIWRTGPDETRYHIINDNVYDGGTHQLVGRVSEGFYPWVTAPKPVAQPAPRPAAPRPTTTTSRIQESLPEKITLSPQQLASRNQQADALRKRLRQAEASGDWKTAQEMKNRLQSYGLSDFGSQRPTTAPQPSQPATKPPTPQVQKPTAPPAPKPPEEPSPPSRSRAPAVRPPPLAPRPPSPPRQPTLLQRAKTFLWKLAVTTGRFGTPAGVPRIEPPTKKKAITPAAPQPQPTPKVQRPATPQRPAQITWQTQRGSDGKWYNVKYRDGKKVATFYIDPSKYERFGIKPQAPQRPVTPAPTPQPQPTPKVQRPAAPAGRISPSQPAGVPTLSPPEAPSPKSRPQAPAVKPPQPAPTTDFTSVENGQEVTRRIPHADLDPNRSYNTNEPVGRTGRDDIVGSINGRPVRADTNQGFMAGPGLDLDKYPVVKRKPLPTPPTAAPATPTLPPPVRPLNELPKGNFWPSEGELTGNPINGKVIKVDMDGQKVVCRVKGNKVIRWVDGKVLGTVSGGFLREHPYQNPPIPDEINIKQLTPELERWTEDGRLRVLYFYGRDTAHKGALHYDFAWPDGQLPPDALARYAQQIQLNGKPVTVEVDVVFTNEEMLKRVGDSYDLKFWESHATRGAGPRAARSRRPILLPNDYTSREIEPKDWSGPDGYEHDHTFDDPRYEVQEHSNGGATVHFPPNSQRVRLQDSPHPSLTIGDMCVSGDYFERAFMSAAEGGGDQFIFSERAATTGHFFSSLTHILYGRKIEDLPKMMNNEERLDWDEGPVTSGWYLKEK